MLALHFAGTPVRVIMRGGAEVWRWTPPQLLVGRTGFHAGGFKPSEAT